MVTIVGFNKRVPPSAASRGTLAELVAKQKLLAEQQAGFGQIQPIQSWTQGAAQMTGALMTGLQQGAAAREESAGRERLAQIRAGINLDTGATSEQIAEAGLLDEDYARDLQEGAARARAEARQAAALIEAREDEQRARAGESALERDARHAENAAQNELTRRGQDIDVTQGRETLGETVRSNKAGEASNEATLAATIARDKANAADQIADRNVTLTGQTLQSQQAAATLKQQQDQLAAERDKPVGDTAQLMDATERFKRGDWGDPKDPANQAIFQAAVQKNTAFAKGLRISFDENGNPIVEQGGMEGGAGGVMDTTAGQKARVASIDEYRADAKAANTALPGVQSAAKTVGSAGYTGPFQGVYGTIDDMLEAGGSMLGVKAGTPFTSLPGTATARDIISKGSLDQVLARVQETKGAISNAEMETFRKAAFGLEKTPESNEMLANMALAIIARANERATRAEKWFNSHGQNMAGFEDQEWQPYINANPLIGTDENGVPVLNQPGGPTQARANQQATTAPAAEAPAAAAPAGVDPALWAEMTPEEKALFAQ